MVEFRPAVRRRDAGTGWSGTGFAASGGTRSTPAGSVRIRFSTSISTSDGACARIICQRDRLRQPAVRRRAGMAAGNAWRR
jgi:hypothetical protein